MLAVMSIARKVAGAAAVVVVGVVAYLSLWPIPAEPVSWKAQTPPGYTGAHAPNTRLSGLRTIDIGSEFGPEHMAIGPDGKLYAAMTSGSLVRMDPDGAKQEVFANTGGRVLGFAFDAQGRMFAADAMKGLLAITPNAAADARVTVLADRVSPDDRIRYANSIVAAPDGTVYFTDASGRFSPSDWGGTYEASVLDIMELLVRQRHRPVFRRAYPVRKRDRPLPDLEGRRPCERPGRAERLAAGEGAARQPAGLSRQPDARP
jgi:hypothetical protein